MIGSQHCAIHRFRAFMFFIARQHAERDIVMANPSVCPSPSHSGVVSQRMHIIVKLFPPSGRDFSFWVLSPLQNSKGNSLSGAFNKRGWVGQFCDFRHKSTFMSEMADRQAHGCYETLIGSHAANRSVSRFKVDLERRSGVKILWRISIITPKRFDLQRRNLVW